MVKVQLLGQSTAANWVKVI